MTNFVTLTKKNTLYYAIGSTILFMGALYNTFPFINGDSSVYISSGIENTVPYERPIFYGYFLRLTSFKMSLWLPALAQCGILFMLLSRMFKVLLPNITKKQSLLVTLVLCLGTGVWFEVAKLMADIFTAYLTLAFFLYIFENAASTFSKILYLFIILYSATCHNSHLVILTLAPFLLWFIFKLVGIRIKTLHWPILVLIPLSWAAVCTSNYVDNGNFTTSRASHVFLMGKMVENGMLKHHLDRRCDSKDWKICQYADSLPITGWQFVWDPKSPVAKTGGWDANKIEYNDILTSIITTPKHLFLLMYKSVIETGAELLQCDYGTDLIRYDEKSNIQQTIYKYYGHEYNRSRWSRQSILEIPFDGLNMWYYLFLIVSTVWVAYLYSIQQIPNQLISAYVFVLAILLVNAFVTANFANIGDRLNTRIFWLLPTLHILSILHSLIHNLKTASK